MRLNRRGFFALLPSGLLAKWFKPKLPNRHYYLILNDDVITLPSKTIQYTMSYWVVDGKATKSFNLKVVTE